MDTTSTAESLAETAESLAASGVPVAALSVSREGTHQSTWPPRLIKTPNRKRIKSTWKTPVYTPSASHLNPVRTFGKVVAGSTAMRVVIDVLERFARTNVTVVLAGETGTGKDVLAHALHDHSERAAGPFVVFDCGAVAPNLAESELLGHERGSFTGAVASYAGAFERANGGTLFLDEIGELPIDLQPRLLRVLESRRVRRVGSGQERPVDVRIVAATNRDLPAEVASGHFREDLYFRLAGAVVPVPPLRARLEDLPLLVPSLLGSLGGGDLAVAEAAIAILRAQAWPGNVRELKNVLGCAMAFVEPDTKLLEARHLQLPVASANDDGSTIDRLPLAGQPLDRLERAAIRQTMAQTEGNKVHAARVLGIAVSTLYEKLKRYGL